MQCYLCVNNGRTLRMPFWLIPALTPQSRKTKEIYAGKYNNIIDESTWKAGIDSLQQI